MLASGSLEVEWQASSSRICNGAYLANMQIPNELLPLRAIISIDGLIPGHGRCNLDVLMRLEISRNSCPRLELFYKN